MVNTSPTSPQPHSHKLLITIIIIVAVLGLAGVVYATYSSNRNDGDGATDRGQNKVPSTSQQQTTQDVSKKEQSTQQPASEAGQEVTLSLHADSGNSLVNTVQTDVKYPSDSLEVVSVNNGTAFPNDIATDKSKPGTIRIVRAVASQSTSVKGDKVVVTITFKKLKTVDAAVAVTVDKAESFLVTSSDNRNLIGSTGSLTIR